MKPNITGKINNNINRIYEFLKLKKMYFNIIFLSLFFILSSITFYTNSIPNLLFIFSYIICIYIIKKIDLKNILKFNLYTFLSFTLLITLINIFLSGLNHSTILTTIKLILTCNLSYILCICLPSYELSNTINYMLKPLNFLRINTQTISLIINIGITFIPILFQEIEKIRISLITKGIKYNSIKNIFYMIKTLIPNLFKKIKEIDYSLMSKGFNE